MVFRARVSLNVFSLHQVRFFNISKLTHSNSERAISKGRMMIAILKQSITKSRPLKNFIRERANERKRRQRARVRPVGQVSNPQCSVGRFHEYCSCTDCSDFVHRNRRNQIVSSNTTLFFSRAKIQFNYFVHEHTFNFLPIRLWTSRITSPT